MDKKGVMPKGKTEKKQKYCTNSLFRHTKQLSLAFVRPRVSLCAIFREKSG